MKECSICKIQKENSEFNKKISQSDGLQTMCRACSSRSGKKHYQNNTDKVKERIYKRRAILKLEVQQFIISYLKEHPCVDCGNRDIRVLEFDHLGNKEYSISEMIGGCYLIPSIKEEISKCEVRCANCHKIKTGKDFNWYKVDSG